MMAAPAATRSGLSKLLNRSSDMQAAALWGVAAGSAAFYLVQPFDWLRKTFFEKPAEEK